ncbi:MAG: hypothetical protein ACOH2V_13280 [Candidatus Saccharimonadaceae bacterium]
MNRKHQLSLVHFLFLGFVATFPAHGTQKLKEESQWFLMRTGMEINSDSENSVEEPIPKTVEYAHYHSKEASIHYNGDLVFGGEYNGLIDDIQERRKFLVETYETVNNSQPSGKQKKEYPNYMAVILCATGKKMRDTEPKRIFSSLRVKKDTDTGKHTFNRKKGSKIAIFYSNANSIDLKDEENYTFLKLSSLTQGHDQMIIDKTKKASPASHTEPLALSAILSLNPATFIEMLGNGCSLMYYEIHLISYYDACEDCPKLVGEFAEKIKGYFTDEKNVPSKKLFSFFHSVRGYGKDKILPYTLKCKLPKNSWNYFNGAIPNFQYIWIKKSEFEKKVKNINADKYDPGSYTLISSSNFTAAPEFYIALCYSLESSNVELYKMHKIQYHY